MTPRRRSSIAMLVVFAVLAAAGLGMVIQYPAVLLGLYGLGIVAAIGPDGESDPRGFSVACRRAEERLREWEKEKAKQDSCCYEQYQD